MADWRITEVLGETYLIDMAALRKFTDPLSMPMTVEPYKPEFDLTGIRFRMMDHGRPCVLDPRMVILSVDDPVPDPWEFMFLFPLGKKAFKKKQRK